MAETTVKFDPMLIISLILQYGIPAAIQIVQLVSKPDFKPEELEGLRGLVRLPSSYLS